MNLRDRLSKGRTDQNLGHDRDKQAAPVEGKRTLSHLMTQHEAIPKKRIEGLLSDYQADPGNVEIAHQLAPLLYHAQDYKRASEVYTRIIETDRGNGQAWMQLANCLARQYSLPEAIKCYQAAIRLLESPELKNKCVKRLALVEDYIRSQRGR